MKCIHGIVIRRIYINQLLKELLTPPSSACLWRIRCNSTEIGIQVGNSASERGVGDNCADRVQHVVLRRARNAFDGGNLAGVENTLDDVFDNTLEQRVRQNLGDGVPDAVLTSASCVDSVHKCTICCESASVRVIPRLEQPHLRQGPCAGDYTSGTPRELSEASCYRLDP